MKVLITGGAGFIGSNLCHHLLAVGGYDVTVLDNLSAGQAEHFLPPAIRVVTADYTNKETLADCVRGADAVVHLAALSGVIESVLDPWPSFRINVEGSFQLLDLLRRAKIGKLINASSGGALSGDVEPPISEAVAPAPLSPYGASKLAVEGYCSAFAGAYGLTCTTLRFSNMYGPRSGHKKSVVAAFIKSIIRNEPLTVYGDGTQQRDYLYVGDLARSIEAMLNRDLKGTFQLGSGKPTSLLQLIDVLGAVTGRSPEVQFKPARAGEVHRTWCDISKAEREIGYTAPTKLEDGLRQTWDWFVGNQDIWGRQMALSSSD